MKGKEKLITIILCSIVLCIYIFIGSYKNMNDSIQKVYKIYLEGNLIGHISNKEELFSLINNKQQDIKDKYGVLNVYPPNSLEVIETYTYNTEVNNINEIYNKIEELQDFTIHGYEVKISETANHEAYSIYVLDKDVFSEAVEDFIKAFISEEDYNNYMNENQGELEDIGMTYHDLKFLEDITIRERYISVKDNIYQTSEELTQDLLFGFDYKERNYIVKVGDTIESIAEEFELNPQEILIANTKYTSKDSLLTIGDNLKIAYVLPELSFSYYVKEMEEVEEEFGTTIIRDNTRPSNYSEITTPGVTGLSLITSGYTVVNGELASSLEIIDQVSIREKVDQVTTKGKKVSAGWQSFKDTGSGWTWPTVSPYIVTSEYGYRSLGGGKKHNGIDISGTPWGSNIYASNDGVVTYVFRDCPNNGSYPNGCGSGYGNQVIIEHENNIYTIYAHMTNDVPVNVGQTVSKGQVIGFMGNSGQSTGKHLHFGVSIGNPKKGGTFYNPRKLFK